MKMKIKHCNLTQNYFLYQKTKTNPQPYDLNQQYTFVIYADIIGGPMHGNPLYWQNTDHSLCHILITNHN